MKMKGIWYRPLVAGLASLAGFALIVTWDLYLNPKINETTITVTNQSILANHTINTTDLTTETVLRSNVIPQEINNKNLLIGKVAAVEIGQGLPILPYMISQNDLIPNETHMTYVIPQKWILGLPNVLRRGDHISIYLVNNAQSSTSSKLFAPTQAQLWLTSVPVEYVLNSAGQEVVNMNPVSSSSSAENRENSSATISEVDVLLTKAQGSALVTACTLDNKLLYITDQNS